MPRKWFVDTNLLVLLVVGATGRHLITKHRRLRRFARHDYDLLLRLIASAKASGRRTGSTEAGAVLVTPNTLTEASNLLDQHQDPERTRFFDTLRTLIERNEEVVVKSVTASAIPEFSRLGLADAVLVQAASAETPLLTVDLDLFHAVATKDHRAAVNFTHLQPL